MSDVTRILNAIDTGDPLAARELLPLVYDELRRMAAAQIMRESPDQSLDATSLVHEAWIRLANPDGNASFENRRHFFAAAAEAMRRVLVDRARQRLSLKRGGGRKPLRLDMIEIRADQSPDEFLALNEALEKLKAELVKLRFFAGLTNQQAADTLGISSSTADNYWAYARSWLRLEIEALLSP